MTDQSETAPAYPLFFSAPQIVNLERHEKTRMQAHHGFGFARTTNSVPLTMADIPLVAKSYPIAFVGTDAPAPVAIVGLEQDNYFVDDENEWSKRDYIPAYVRQYPFAFQQTESGELLLSVDEPALDMEGTGEGPQFYEDGKATSFTQKAFEFCSAFHRDREVTIKSCVAFARLGLLSDRNVETKLPSGRILRLGGLSILDEEKFRALPEADIVRMHQEGALGLAYYILQSQTNWALLLEMAGTREEAAAA